MCLYRPSDPVSSEAVDGEQSTCAEWRDKGLDGLTGRGQCEKRGGKRYR